MRCVIRKEELSKQPWLILAVTVLVIGLVLGSLEIAQRWGSKSQPLASGAPLEDVVAPSIDRDQPADFKTATFASG